jgi:uncharacterized membrane protein
MMSVAWVVGCVALNLFHPGRDLSGFIVIVLLIIGAFYIHFRLLCSEYDTYARERARWPLFAYVGMVGLFCITGPLPTPQGFAAAFFVVPLFVAVLSAYTDDSRVLIPAHILSIVGTTIVLIAYRDIGLGCAAGATDNFTPLFTFFLIPAALFSARAIMKFIQPREFPGRRPEKWAAPPCRSDHLFSIAGAVTLIVLISDFVVNGHGVHAGRYSGALLTVGWGAEGLILAMLGIAMKDRLLRIMGLGLLGICILKLFPDVFFMDAPRNFKAAALIGLGLILLATGLLYSRFREKLRDFIPE